MIYVKFRNDLPVKLSYEYPKDGEDSTWQCRWDWHRLDRVETIAAYLTAMTGDLHIGIDRGNHVSPRFDIIRAPKVGDKASYAFNGDSYPDGEVTKVTKTLQVTTSTGSIYRRKKGTGVWLKPGGTWYLVNGHVYSQNPHF